MAKINIIEKDLTRGTAVTTTDIAFIPGLRGTGFDADSTYVYDVPVLFTTVAQFEKVVGKQPHVFTSENTDYRIKENDADKSFIMAHELLNQGMSIYYYTPNITEMKKTADPESDDLDLLMEGLGNYLDTDDLKDKGEYTVKYLTTGGYHNFKDDGNGLWSDLVAIAAARGDCIALVEAENNASRALTGTGSFLDTLSSKTTIDGLEYAAAFSPWARFATKFGNVELPACFSYLLTLAANVKTRANWLAMAGTSRGLIPNIGGLNTNTRFSNPIANDYYQLSTSTDTIKVAINPITNIKPYGLCIWGNRTLKPLTSDGLVASHFLNTRNMLSDIKKLAYNAAKARLFEQNTETLWLDFKAAVSPFLEQLKAGNGIKDYKILKTDLNSNGKPLGKEEFSCMIQIYPLYAVETFDISITINDDSVNVQ